MGRYSQISAGAVAALWFTLSGCGLKDTDSDGENSQVVMGDCDKNLPSILAHKSFIYDTFVTSIIQNFPSSKTSPQEIEDKAKTMFEERTRFYETLFSCQGNEELNILAQKLRNNPRNGEIFSQVLNTIFISNYKKAADYHNVESFEKWALKVIESYKESVDAYIKEEGIPPIDYVPLDKEVNEEIRKLHESLVKTAVYNDLHFVFGMQDVALPATMNTVEEIVRRIYSEEVDRKIAEKNGVEQEKNDGVFPYLQS